MTRLRRHLLQAAAIGLAALLAGCASTAPTPDRPEARPEVRSETADQLEAAAARWMGTPYRYGGTSTRGIDCSGLLQVLYAEALGQSLPRTTGEQKRLGQPVPEGMWQPGDLVFFDTPGKAQHAGIYLRGGRFVHASTSQGVTISNLSAPYWQRTYEQSRRVLPQQAAPAAPPLSETAPRPHRTGW